MTIKVETTENAFDTGGDQLTVVKQVVVTTPYGESFCLDPDEAEVLLDGLETALYHIGYFEVSN